MTDSHELAWAAGFFDGEGHVGCKQYRTNANYMQLALSIAQASDAAVLLRFQKAVGCGSVLGPYGPYKNRGGAKPFYLFTARNQVEVKQIIERLSPWLSSVKKAQAAAAIEKWESRPWKHEIHAAHKRKPERVVALVG